MELQSLQPLSVDWLTVDDLKPRGRQHEIEVPDTLDLAERGSIALHGLTHFLDRDQHFSSFGHALFAVKPPCLIHDHGMAQNWGKIVEAMILARAMCGSEADLDGELDSVRGMISYAAMKKNEPYPVPLARILMALESLYSQSPKDELRQLAADCRQCMLAQVRIDGDSDEAFFGTEDQRWWRDDRDHATGPIGYGLQLFTGGNVLRASVRASHVNGIPFDEQAADRLKRYLLEERFWSPNEHPRTVVPSLNGQFWGHHHSYTQGLLGLLYLAHQTNSAWLKEFVRKSYEYLRTFGIARIGLFGEGCTCGDMTYLAVRLSQWGVGDYWEDVDQYVRNHLTELQILDTDRLTALVNSRARPLDPSELGDWAQGIDTRDAVQRSRGLFWSDASHPTLIPLRENLPPHATCLQWVVCCSGNCTKALHEVWSGMVDYDEATSTARLHLLLNRASAWLDVDSYLPYEGRVIIRNKCAGNLAIRIPCWVDRTGITCDVNGSPTNPAWIGNYLLLTGRSRNDEIAIRFPMVESKEVVALVWQQDQFWLESTQPPGYWELREPQVYTLSLRGNTLSDISPRDQNAGMALYHDRSPERYRVPATCKRVARFISD